MARQGHDEHHARRDHAVGARKAALISRRALLAAALAVGLLAAATPAANAQPTTKVWRIGWLGDGTRATREANTLAPLREGLRELGYIEGKNILIDARWSDGDSERLARDAADFVRLRWM